MTPEQHEAVSDAHLMWTLQSAAQYLTSAAIYVGMAREAPHWMSEVRRSIGHAKQQLSDFETELAEALERPAAFMRAKAEQRTPATTPERTADGEPAGLTNEQSK